MIEKLGEVFAPRVETVGSIGALTLGYSGNGDDRLQYSIHGKVSGEVTFDPVVDGPAPIEQATLTPVVL
jgi:hypothetical protein